MAIIRSIVFSVLASTLATMAARRILSAYQPASGDEGKHPAGNWGIVIVIPALAGNSSNRIGYVREVHHHHHHSLFGRGKRN